MLASNSVILTIVDRVRTILDESETDAKYSNDYMLSSIIPDATNDVLGRLNADRKNKVAVRYTFSTVANQEFYRLPPNVAQLFEVNFVDTSNNVYASLPHRPAANAAGPGYDVEGNELRLLPKPQGVHTCEVVYMPHGGSLPHYATDGSLNVDKDTITLSASPASGRLDRREGAYNGSIVRVIPSSGPVEEAVVQSHQWTGSAWTLTLRRPLIDTADGTITYEIIDQPTLGLTDCITWAAVIRIAASRRVSGTAMRNYQIMYNTALKTEGDRMANYDIRDNYYRERTKWRRPDPSRGIMGL
jgi:hypothetical protein